MRLCRAEERDLGLNQHAPSVASWEAFARDLAGMHLGTVHDQFGWHRDGYMQLRFIYPYYFGRAHRVGRGRRLAPVVMHAPMAVRAK